MRVVHPWAGTGMACLLFSLALASPAAAQDQTSSQLAVVTLPASNSSQDQCRATGIPVPDSDLLDLRIGCGTRGLMLGLVSDFQVLASSAELGSLLELRIGHDRRVVLIRQDKDGAPTAEDLSSDLAIAAGRSAMSTIADLNLASGDFVTRGTISVNSNSAATKASRQGTVDVGAIVSLEAGRQ